MDGLETVAHAPAFEQVWIPLPDGTRLAGRLWRAVGTDRAPAVLEWIPYRQSDLTAVGDSMVHGYFAMYGIAALRIDLRGSGNSEGLLEDEYTLREQDDAVAAIAWIAAQNWCTGAVGMIGISWSGFAALQVAARRPPALRAIITCCSTDDRYRDDVHYMGGALLSDGLQWGVGLFAQIARPPDPAHTGPRWREMWEARLAGLAPPLAIWLSHPERDAYWRHGSVCEDYDAIACPVLAVGGWTDGYPDPVLRLMEHLSVPRQAVIGPWTHMYPTWGKPGPTIGFLQECVRWWKRWLDDEAGVEPPGAAPMLRLFLGQDLQPSAQAPSIGGRWLALPAWPPDDAPERRLHLRNRQLVEAAGPVAASLERSVPLESPPWCGAAGGEWCPLDGGGDGPEFATDQREDDAMSVCFDGPVLEEPLELVGAAVFEADLALDGAASLLALRLCEVAADGRSARITFGLARVVRPEGVAPGTRFRQRFVLKSSAYAFLPGRRLRLALSDAYWPMAWPEARPAGLVLWPGSAVLTLPGLPAAARVEERPFGTASAAPPIPHEVLSEARYRRVRRHDETHGVCELDIASERAITRLGELTFGGSATELYRIGADPGSASVTFRRTQFMRRPGWDVRLETEVSIARRDDVIEMRSAFAAFLNEEPAFARSWNHRFPDGSEAGA